MAPEENSALSPNVLLIDGNQLRRAGIACLLSEWAEPLRIAIKQAAPADILREFEDETPWQLVLLSVGGDSISRGENGTLMRVLPALATTTPLVVMSDREAADEIMVAYRAGCRGYVPTSMAPRLALQALGFILDGGSYFPPSALGLIEGPGDHPGNGGSRGPGGHRQSIALQARSELRGSGSGGGGSRPKPKPKRNAIESEPNEVPDANGLTLRQQEVLDYLRDGRSNKLIARALGLTEGTVKVHVRQIMRKFNATNRTEVAVLSIRVRRTAPTIVPPVAGELRVVESLNGLPRSAA